MRKGIKRLLLWTVVLTLAVSLIGCGSDEAANGGTEKETATPKAEEAKKDDTKAETASDAEVPELTIMMPASWYQKGWEAVQADADAKADELGFKLVFDKMPEGDEGRSLSKVRFASGELPDFYMHAGINIAVSEFKDAGFFEDISGDWTNNYNQKDIDSYAYSYDGVPMALPVGGSTLFGGFYNEEVFDELGLTPPNTWDELIETAYKLKEAGKTPIYISGKDAWTIQWPVRNSMTATQDSQEVFDKINTHELTYAELDDFEDGMLKTKALIDDGLVNETYLTDTFDDAQRALVNGEAGMYFLGTWTVDEIGAKFPDEVDKIRGFATPYIENSKVYIGYPNALMMTSGIEDKELGMKFIEYLTSKETQKLYFDAQPGVAIVKDLDVDMHQGAKDLLEIYNMDGRGDILPNRLTLYNWGDMSPFADFYIGSITAQEAIETLDTTTEKNAKAAKDPNWD